MSGQNHKYGDAPRMRRQPAGTDRHPNAIVFMVLTTQSARP